MAELAAAAVTAIGSAFTGGAATATAGAATVASGGFLSSLLSTSTLTGILSGGATVVSAIAAQRSAKEQAQSLEFTAQDTESDIVNEELAGMERRSSMRKELFGAIAERQVAFAASGVDLSFGTPALAQEEAIDDATDALSLDQNAEDIRKGKLRQRASGFRQQAAGARRGGLARSAGLILDGATDIMKRGVKYA